MNVSGNTGVRTPGCRRPLEPDLAPAEREFDVRVASALSNGTRYAALRLLASADEPVCVCDVEARLDVSQSAVSHALSALHAVGLVDRRSEGRWRYYSPTPQAGVLLDALDAARGDR